LAPWRSPSASSEVRMPQVEPWIVLSFCATIFFIGLFGVMVRRNILIVLMCIELMLNAVNLTFVTFSSMHQDMTGQMSVFFIITVAAAESAVGLGLVIAMFRTLRSVDTDEIQMLRE
jgi:NADH-quinone oxidoreductase subunit K